MTNKFSIVINKKIKKFDKLILVEGDKSISHRALLIASQCLGTSVIKGLLESEDVKNTIVCLKKLGVKIFKNKNRHIVCGNGFGSFKKPKNNELYMGNSGTLARLILGIIATHPNLSIKISGDTSLNKRDMDRVIRPLSKIGCNFYPKNKKKLPLKIVGTEMPLAQYHYEKIGSAQVKSSILLAALNTPGITKIKEEKKSRDHTEKLLKFINADIKVKKMNSKNLIAIKGEKNLKSFNLKVPGDPSSAAPFIVLTFIIPSVEPKVTKFFSSSIVKTETPQPFSIIGTTYSNVSLFHSIIFPSAPEENSLVSSLFSCNEYTGPL